MGRTLIPGRIKLWRLLAIVGLGAACGYAQAIPRSIRYEALQKRLATGWNTWDVHSVTTQVLLPSGFAISMGIHLRTALNGDAFLSHALIGRMGPAAEHVLVGPHAWEGSYSSLKLSWRGVSLRVESAHAGSDLVLLVTPLTSKPPSHIPATIVFSAGYLWNRPGSISMQVDSLDARGPMGKVDVYCDGAKAPFNNVPVTGPYLARALTEPVAISTGKRRSVSEIKQLIEEQRESYKESLGSRIPRAVDAIETTLGWDTIYDPEGDRVISPVSRIWSLQWGGYVLFDWDTFFAATLASVGDRDLAYANAIEILNEATSAGFVPNYARAGGWKSFDRSEPPVGAITVLGLYRKFHERWFLEETFEPLLRWNRWWQAHRRMGRYLVWGTDGNNKPEDPDDSSAGTRQGAIYESGLDNSPMYDAAGFDPKTGKLLMADVGLMSEYIADSDALAEIASLLNRPGDEEELRRRADFYRSSLASLWDDKSGIFLNKDLRNGKLSPRISPTNLYPLLARAATAKQARRMIEDHLLNPNEFWGKWVIPSTPRDDPAFKDQSYWRGRIWGPMNYLVYLGLRNYARHQVRADFAAKSFALLLQEWDAKRHVHENYNAITGWGDDVTSSDRFYHWGALLALIQYLEATAPDATAH